MAHESHRADGPSSGTPVALPSVDPPEASVSMHEVSGKQRRKLFRTAYEGKTLREHYGLAWPKSAFKEAALQEA